MARKLSEEQARELEHIKDWCLAILHFLMERDGAEIWKDFLEVVATTYERNNLTGLRSVFRDINEMAGGMALKDKIELNRRLFDRFGKNLLTESKKDLARLRRIMDAGKIRTEVECRLILERVDQIYMLEDQRAELDTLNTLLVEYHRKKETKS